MLGFAWYRCITIKFFLLKFFEFAMLSQKIKFATLKSSYWTFFFSFRFPFSNCLSGARYWTALRTIMSVFVLLFFFQYRCQEKAKSLKQNEWTEQEQLKNRLPMLYNLRFSFCRYFCCYSLFDVHFIFNIQCTKLYICICILL